MICDICEKCWLNYIEDCEGLNVFSEDRCKKVELQKDFEESPIEEGFDNSEFDNIKRKIS